MAYAPPNEDTVCIAGGLGTQADAASTNGGGATKAAWDAGSPSDFMGANGGYIFASAAISFTTATKTLSATNIGLNTVVGTIINVWGGDGSHVTAGRYEITTVTDNDNIICAQIDDDGTNDDNLVGAVGGAIAHPAGGSPLQEALDLDMNDASSYNRYIYDNVAVDTISASIVADTNGGSSSGTRVIVIGYNSTLTAEAEIKITTDQDITEEATVDDQCLLSIQAVDYYSFHNIYFDGGGKDANLAKYCLVADTSTDGVYNCYYNCRFSRAEADGVYCISSDVRFVNCIFSDNGGRGFNSIGLASSQIFICCSFHDNDTDGLYTRPWDGVCIDCYFYDNGKDGTGAGLMYSSNGRGSIYAKCLFYGNADDGFQYNSSSYGTGMLNCAFIGNGAYGLDMQGASIRRFDYFGYNLGGANTTAHTSACANGDFPELGNGNNVNSSQTADQLLTTITDGSEDFTPESGSDLIDNALSRTL